MLVQVSLVGMDNEDDNDQRMENGGDCGGGEDTIIRQRIDTGVLLPRMIPRIPQEEMSAGPLLNSADAKLCPDCLVVTQCCDDAAGYNTARRRGVAPRCCYATIRLLLDHLLGLHYLFLTLMLNSSAYYLAIRYLS